MTFVQDILRSFMSDSVIDREEGLEIEVLLYGEDHFLMFI